jgi:hypothetical protein
VEPIFINFRTGDQDMAAPFLHDYLESRLGEGVVFYSSRSIRIGDDFPAELQEHAAGCAVMLALVGPGWLTVAGADGQPRLANPGDWVRREIATALAADRRVVPVLVGDALRLSGRDNLPSDIAPLADREHCYLRRRSLAADLVALEEELVKVIKVLRPARPRPVPRGGTATVAVNDGGDVAGVRICDARASGRALRDFTEGFSVNIGYQGPGSSAAVADIGKWDGTEQWGNAEYGPGAPAPYV